MVLSTVCPLILPAAALEGDTYCGIEAHEHGQECYTRALICGQDESAAAQGGESANAPERLLICTLEEKESGIHTHGTECYTQTQTLACGLEEDANAHTHTDSCAVTEQRLICADESEEHEHGEGCYETVTTMQCGIEEGAPTGHVHTEGCYITEEKLSCGLEEGAELPGHAHTDACYAAEETPDAAPEEGAANADPTGTGAEETGHTHTEACYTATLTCEKKEHRHELKCFSNPEADVENEEVWARSVSGVALTGEWADDLIAIAQSQLGYAESTRNYSVDEHGDIRGYSRYGAWYGNAYGDWCAMFVSFCLHYAGIPTEAFPYRSACGQWVETLQAEECGLWREREAYTPKKGDVIFFDTDGDSEADHVGIIAELGLGADGQLEKINTIEGNYGDCVQRVEHSAKEDGIVGFGALPENPETERLRTASTEADKNVTVTDENGTEATTNEWSPEQSAIDEARKKLDNALVMVGQGYTLRSVEYYEISGLTGSRATVTYSGGGLSAGNAEEVFVYDLGADGTGLESCTVSGSEKNPDTDTFSKFSFTLPTGGDGTARIYAFISASHATLEEMGIYLGEQQENDSWVVYDTKDPTEANVKATLTLPVGVSAPEGYCPFIRKIREGEGYYPKEEAVLTEAGANNGWQCYTIRWIKQDDSGIHMIPLNENGSSEKLTVQVKIEYLKKEEQLPGPAGGRKLLIFNSLHDGSLADQVADTVENVLVDADSYTSFTFRASHSGPYVFVSKTLEKGYIDSLNLGKEKGIVDGSAPFDSSDTPGNDSGENNRIIRSYDTIQYNLEASFAAREDGIKQKTVDMYFELTLGKSSTAARFDISKMTWLGEKYSIEYLNSSGEVIMVMAHDGKFYQPLRDESGEVCRNEYGFALTDTDRGKISINAGVNGSTAGENSYKVASGGVATQRLVGCTTLTAKEGENILSGTQKFPLAVEVRNADNGEVFAPRFKMWLEGNEENYGPETRLDNGTLLPATPDTGNVLDISEPGNEAFKVTVSAGTNFNLQLKKNGDMSYKNWFDFATGEAVTEPDRSDLERLAALEENHGKADPAEFTDGGMALSADLQARYANYRYGRLTCYGITLQLYSDTDNKPEENRAAKGLKGMSLPVGEITFDLSFSSTVKANGQTLDNSEYPAILWDYNENIPANIGYTFHYDDPGRETVSIPATEHGNGGRRLYWDGESRSAYAKGGGPSNYRDYHHGCYYGGDWLLVDGAGNKAEISTLANPGAVTGGGTTYHFSVSDYDFDFDGQHFPTQDAGNSGNVPGYGSYAQCFSAGCVQVLSVFPRVQETSEAELFLNTTVSNLKLETRAGQQLAPREGDDSGYGHEVNQNDNSKSDQIVLYAPGNMTKGNSFNGKQGGQDPKTTAGGFLGTEYWTTSYDCSTFAGDEIWIMSYGMLSSGGDFRTRSMNLLQLFDSRALNIRGEPTLYQEANAQYGEEKGTVCFLYAADPYYPKGYDTNAPGILEYMNTVREEDLRYFTSLNELQQEGFTCVGVLMELRGCNLLGGKYQYMSIPVKVNGEDETLVGKTVATVNTARVWSTDQSGISWKNGVWNDAEGRNVLAGYNRPTNKVVDGEYSAELANSQTKSPPHYVKTEYWEGLQVQGTHAGGTLSGNSLLILSYKAEIGIGVDNKGESSKISYNLGSGETVVDYRLKNIRTVISDPTGQTENPKTTLTINAVLDEGHTGAQRISVAGGSYRMEGYAVSADGTTADTTSSIAIGSDPNEPTVLEYVDSDGNRQRIKAYAQMGANNQSVRFVIQDAPVGKQLPDIIFQANFAAVTALQNNDTIKTSAYISGTGDNRAYSEAKGNTDNITVSIIMIGGSNLTKAVDTNYIELNGGITYTVTYTNSGSDAIGKIYFYDLLPKRGDIRGSDYNGSVELGEVGVESSREDGIPPAGATVYYSTTEYRELYDRVKEFEGGATAPDAEEKIEKLLTGGVTDSTGQTFFMPLGEVTGGSFTLDSAYDALTAEEKSRITGLYVKAENLQKGQTINVTIRMKTNGNRADDWYKNIANSWIAGSATTALTSNKVETQAVSRRISGVVWYDKNLNGVRDADEERLGGVTATLFKRNGAQYEKCMEDVTGVEITPVTTGTDGVYSFDKLTEGEYIVAFSGEALEKFTGGTKYQVRGRNDADTNDGVVNSDPTAQGIDKGQYPYVIRFSQSEKQMQLHSITDMQQGRVSLNNGVETYANQDLGLVTGKFALAKTGGAGTAPYTAAGLLLMGMAGLPLCRKAKRKGGKA